MGAAGLYVRGWYRRRLWLDTGLAIKGMHSGAHIPQSRLAMQLIKLTV
jgi:hypothetical protein